MRDSRMDNIRFLLIFLVAMGHFLEVSSSATLMNATEFIYSFHMPAFVFISGYFAKFNPQRSVRTYLYSYVILQTLYYFFSKYYLENSTTVYQLTIPNYTLWYLPAMAFYTMIIPIIHKEDVRQKIVVLVISIVLSLSAGSDAGIGYPFASGRILAFLPFFVLGHYCRCEDIGEKLKKLKTSYKVILGAVLVFAVAAVEAYIIKSPHIKFIDMTYSYPYSQTEAGWKARAVLMVAGVLWISLLLIVIPNKKIPLVSEIGANTFPIYIFHGFVVKVLIKNNIVNLSAGVYAALAVVCSLVFLIMFGNKIASKIAKWGFTGHWMSALDKK